MLWNDGTAAAAVRSFQTGIFTQSELHEKIIFNMVEDKACGAYLMGLPIFGNYSLEDTVNFPVYISKTEEHFAAGLTVVLLQLFSILFDHGERDECG